MRTRNTTRGGRRLFFALFAVLALIVAACAEDDSRGSQTTIKLAVNPWNGSAANVAVAAQLLEDELGYTVAPLGGRSGSPVDRGQPRRLGCVDPLLLEGR